jgi:hypothetical protein
MCTGWVLVGTIAALHESHCCEAVIGENHSSELFDVNTRNVFARTFTSKYLLADNTGTVCIMCAAHRRINDHISKPGCLQSPPMEEAAHHQLQKWKKLLTINSKNGRSCSPSPPNHMLRIDMCVYI